MATEQAQTNERLLEKLAQRVAELSVPYAHALAEYDAEQSLANWKAVDRAQARWRRAVDELDNYCAVLEAKCDDSAPGF